MRPLVLLAILLSTVAMTGCARIQFQEPADDALTYYETKPYFLIQEDAACTYTARVVSIPGKKRGIKLQPGMGVSKFTVSLTPDGTLASVNQESDTKLPETINAVTGLAGSFAGFMKAGGEEKCKTDPKSNLYPIVDGKVDTDHPVRLTF